MESTGKKTADKQGVNEGEAHCLMLPRLSSKLKELQDLSARWARLKSGDPGVLDTYHGSQARGV